MKLARIALFVSLMLASLAFTGVLALGMHPGNSPALTPLPTFTPIPIPTLISPAQGSPPTLIRPLLDWDEMPGATLYAITVSAYSNFAYPLVDQSVSRSIFILNEDLPRNITIYWRVRVAQPYTSAWASSTFVTPNPPYSPAPVSPGLGAAVTNYTLTLDWAASIIPDGTTFAYYELQVDDANDFSSPLVARQETDIASHAYTFSDPLLPNTPYFWRVRTANTLGQTSMWRYSWFITSLQPPSLISPASLEVPNTLRPLLDWSDVPGATGYGVEVSMYPDFSSKSLTLAVPDSSYQPTYDLPRNKVLYWRVRTHGGGVSAWVTSSYTSPNPPDPVTLLTPIRNGYVNNTPTLVWTKAVIPPGAEFAYYQLQISKGDFSGLYLDTTLNDISRPSFTFTPENQLDPNNGSWHWRVRVANTANQFSAWAYGDFLTYPPTPTPTATRTPTVTPVPLTQTFTNAVYGLTFSYPASAVIVDNSNIATHINLPFIAGTSLNGKSLEIHIWNASIGSCASRRFGQTSSATETINSITFLHETGTEPGAVNFQDWNSYSVAHNGFCVNLFFNLVYDNPNFYPTPRPAFDKTAETAVFGQVIRSLRWLPVTATPTPLPPAAPLTQLYQNLPNGFRFYYPSDAGLIYDDVYYARIGLAIIPGTNLGDKYMEVSAWDASRPCEKTPAGGETSHRLETINGLSFFVQEGWEGAAGNIYEWISYSTYDDAICANMVLILHSTNPGAYQYPPLLYDKAAESAVFRQIVNTFSWLPARTTLTPTPSETPLPSDTPTPSSTPAPSLTPSPTETPTSTPTP